MEQSKILLRLRKEKGLSQAELAEELGITRQTISRWEAGVSTPSAENLIGLSRVYGMTVEEMYQRGRGEEPPPEEDSKEIPASVEENTQQGGGEQAGRNRRIRLLGAIVMIAVYVSVYIWGVLTHSQHTAIDNLVFITFALITISLLYGVYRVIKLLKKGQ